MHNSINNTNDDNCIFCKIIRREIPADVVFENDDFLAFKDINPAAPIHILLIPKNHIGTLADCTDAHIPLLGRMMQLAPQIATMAGAPAMPGGGHRVLMNVGPQGGQQVYHIHLHILAGPEPWRGFSENQ